MSSSSATGSALRLFFSYYHPCFFLIPSFFFPYYHPCSLFLFSVPIPSHKVNLYCIPLLDRAYRGYGRGSGSWSRSGSSRYTAKTGNRLRAGGASSGVSSAAGRTYTSTTIVRTHSVGHSWGYRSIYPAYYYGFHHA